jgi:Zn finger protein HypA/HybF involved in hydrogenase expression
VHELSLALEICRITESQVGTSVLPRVQEVGIRVGTDSGVEPDSLAFCLEALLSAAPFSGARLRMELCDGDDLRVSYLEVEDDDPPN